MPTANPRPSPRSHPLWRVLVGVAFMLAGVNHFRSPNVYVAIMPPYLPWPGALVALSGYAEVALGALACVPSAARPARWGLIALLVAVFPANMHMALNAQRYPIIPAWVLWVRLPLQVLLIAAVQWCLPNPAQQGAAGRAGGE